jgi:PPOX class probable F420-dependent enzyme
MATYEMTPDELTAFLAETRFVTVATLRSTGAPLVVPVGFVYENGSMYFTIKSGRGMITRLRRDNRMSALVANEEFPTVYVIFEGRGEFVDDPGHEISRRINRRYMTRVPGLDLDAFERNWLEGGRQVVRLTPERITSWDTRKKRDYVEEAGITIAEQRRAERLASG